MPTIFINDLMQLYRLQHVLNNQVFILRKTCTCRFWYFFMLPCKQFGRSWHRPDTMKPHDIMWAT